MLIFEELNAGKPIRSPQIDTKSGLKSPVKCFYPHSLSEGRKMKKFICCCHYIIVFGIYREIPRFPPSSCILLPALKSNYICTNLQSSTFVSLGKVDGLKKGRSWRKKSNAFDESDPISRVDQE